MSSSHLTDNNNNNNYVNRYSDTITINNILIVIVVFNDPIVGANFYYNKPNRPTIMQH